MIKDAGLKPVHIFIETAAITGAWDEWRGIMTLMAERMKMPVPASFQHGLQRIGTSMLLPGDAPTQ